MQQRDVQECWMMLNSVSPSPKLSAGNYQIYVSQSSRDHCFFILVSSLEGLVKYERLKTKRWSAGLLQGKGESCL